MVYKALKVLNNLNNLNNLSLGITPLYVGGAYPLKFTKKQREILKVYWKDIKEVWDSCYVELAAIEEEMQEELGIPYLEILYSFDGSINGIGTQWVPEEEKYALLEREVLDADEK